MSLIISKVFTYDTDAGNYIQAVEAADGAALEPATRQAINNFVIGCKQDGIWSAIKASCILSGARTLAGALQPLAGTAPTNFNFVAGDYNRKTGLVGDGSTKYLDSNRNNNADPQDSRHLSFYVSSVPTAGAAMCFIGAFPSSSGSSYVYQSITSGTQYSTNLAGSVESLLGIPSTGFVGVRRGNASNIESRKGSIASTFSSTSAPPLPLNLHVYRLNRTSAQLNTNARLAFYSIGESLDLALLDARVTALITAFGVAIP